MKRIEIQFIKKGTTKIFFVGDNIVGAWTVEEIRGDGIIMKKR